MAEAEHAALLVRQEAVEESTPQESLMIRVIVEQQVTSCMALLLIPFAWEDLDILSRVPQRIGNGSVASPHSGMSPCFKERGIRGNGLSRLNQLLKTLIMLSIPSKDSAFTDKHRQQPQSTASCLKMSVVTKWAVKKQHVTGCHF